MKHLFSTVLLLFSLQVAIANTVTETPHAKNAFMGMWTLAIEGGGVGWLEVHDKQGYLDASLLWIGGSVLPVGHVYLADEETLVVTRTYERTKQKDPERKHTITNILRVKKVGDAIEGKLYSPEANGMGVNVSSFTGTLLPDVPPAPDLSKVKYGPAIELFNGSDLSGWKMIDPDHANGFKAVDGDLVNEPTQTKGEKHLHYGNLRTVEEFEDFNLKLEVNVPVGNNSGVYLRGIYEIQVVDSYGKELDSHNMGALYSRITPKVVAEKPGGSWQSLDITLCDRHVTVILNGQTIIDNQPAYGPTGGAMSPDVFAAGPLYLQGDHGNVSYRNMVLKPIL